MKYTKTSSFLFPLLEIKKSIFACEVNDTFERSILRTRFINAYLQDTLLAGSSYNEGAFLMILLNSYQDPNFDSFYTTMTAFPNYKDDYERGDNMVMIYEIPERRTFDYEILLQGKYSKITVGSKKLIMDNAFFHSMNSLPSILSKGVDFKEHWERTLSNPGINYTAHLNDQEVWSAIDEKEEIITNEILKKCTTTKHI